ncbi:type VI secretion system baseplate subunit TssE [Serratia sp. UGAL515B_01]|uniref:type VI secretion system baseplate subunit TssE n=1 Tax=Serratia sp. UGAL515B_01 TaxID=2986763 RepID=UPI0029538645|nr:GPW/gp25 family protein [Serratia sp. UGAL515B_01]WON77494.1 GPW/gp25 family protein [Serratia sp. UGAL515B_01]
MKAKRKPFLPCLWDRLLDDEPRQQTEAWDKYHFDIRAMRAMVQRNIFDILNTANIESRLTAGRHREVASSVLNFGISPLVGGHATPHNWTIIERMIREALLRFEPRLLPESIIINLHGDKKSPVSNGVINFEIRGLVAWDPHPFDLSLGARYDIETDSASVKLNN